jgi:uncharacterized membrane protein
MKALVNKKTVFLAQFGMLLAIEIIVCFTPLGSVPIGPMVATLGMMPVIITAILLGTSAGSVMGFFAGLFSFCVMTFMPPTPVAFVFTPFYSIGEIHGNFWSLVICFVPRILVGTVTGLCFRLFDKLKWKKVFTYSVSGVLGSLTNTFLVLGGIYVFFGQSYATVIGTSYNALLGLIGLSVLTNGIPEAIIGAVAAYAVCFPIKKHMQKNFE